jgi:hypothetical protein
MVTALQRRVMPMKKRAGMSMTKKRSMTMAMAASLGMNRQQAPENPQSSRNPLMPMMRMKACSNSMPSARAAGVALAEPARR